MIQFECAISCDQTGVSDIGVEIILSLSAEWSAVNASIEWTLLKMSNLVLVEADRNFQ